MPRIRVLVVDDAVVIRRMITEALGSDPDIEVVGTSANGRIALQKIPQVNPDIITMDVEMPEMDGLEATRIIREELKINTPIIAITANAVKEELESYIEKGMNDYITKPFEEKTLLSKIEQWAFKTN